MLGFGSSGCAITSTRRPPLHGTSVIEIGGVGPTPFVGMYLADLGAEVTTIERPTPGSGIVEATTRSMSRGKNSIGIDLKSPEGASILSKLLADADVLIEGFRPGVMERMGFSPESCRERFPRLVYARVTGWGRTGPRSLQAGHDINYIAVAGLLDQIGDSAGAPTVPLNIVGDFAAGGMFTVAGILAALFERERSGLGQVVDSAMVSGVAYLQTMFLGLKAEGEWDYQRGGNFADGSRPYYTTYATSDSRSLAVGCIEPQFYAAFLDRLELKGPDWEQLDPMLWASQRASLTDLFATRPLAVWMELFEGSDACVSPVLSLAEAAQDPHLRAEGVFLGEGPREVNVVPRFSSAVTKAGSGRSEVSRDAFVSGVLDDLGYSKTELEDLLTRRVVS